MTYNGMCKSFFLDLFTGDHDLDNDAMMIALYTDRNVMSPDLTAYTTNGEVSGINYIPGGNEIFKKDGYPRASERYVAEMSFEDVVFPNITASIGAALIYNLENGRAIRCIDFGLNQNVTASDFRIRFPTENEPPIFIILPKG